MKIHILVYPQWSLVSNIPQSYRLGWPIEAKMVPEVIEGFLLLIYRSNCSLLFLLLQSLRKITRTTMELEELSELGTTISAKKQKLFKGFSFVSDKWKAIQKLN